LSPKNEKKMAKLVSTRGGSDVSVVMIYLHEVAWIMHVNPKRILVLPNLCGSHSESS
jgi:hypothetical protein